ncbi:hypothetical protein B0H13DRAFT_2101554 [Mycena leptocephala]|nr:hypothetical protein B0H13DRAFT_2101554 [Mycena leptocephala]
MQYAWIVFMQRDASVDVRPDLLYSTEFFHWQNAGAIMQYQTTQSQSFILSLRLYSMYGRSRKALVLLITLILAELGAMIVFFETLVLTILPRDCSFAPMRIRRTFIGWLMSLL